MIYRDYKNLEYYKKNNPEYAQRVLEKSCEEKFALYQEILEFWQYMSNHSPTTKTFDEALEIVKLYQQFEMNNLLFQILDLLEKQNKTAP